MAHFFRSSSQPSGNRLLRSNVYQMAQLRKKAAGIETPIGNHSFRGTGITNFIQNGRTGEQA